MQTLKTAPALDQSVDPLAEVAELVAEAARAVPPLWPLSSAIAVNPLTLFEDRPFAEALRTGADLFGARPTLPMKQWNALLGRGDIQSHALREAAIERLGGLDQAFALLGPDVSRLDLLLARLSGADAESEAPGQRAAAARLLGSQATGPRRFPSPAERTGVAMLGYSRAFVAKWCGAFFDRSIACAGMPHRQLGLYRAVLKLAAFDPDFYRFAGDDAAGIVASAEREPLRAIHQCLMALGLEGQHRLDLLRVLVARLPGWAGHIRWRTAHADPRETAGAPAGMADYLALWLLVERACALREWPVEPGTATDDPRVVAAGGLASVFGLDLAALPGTAVAHLAEIAELDDAELGLIWMRAAELSYRDTLVPQLERAATELPSEPQERPFAQLVMCIDVRSEPFRRALEAQGSYDTYGYAGFFGLPVAMHGTCGTVRKQLPVLLEPAFALPLTPANDGASGRLKANEGQARAEGLTAELKGGAGSSFAAAEALGPIAALSAALRTLAPKLVRSQPERHMLRPSLEGQAPLASLPLDARIQAARTFFAATGMPRKTARLVVLAGHGGEAVNNPYASALDCGACGGHAGGWNAQAMAAVLNDRQVRAALAEDGEAIPADTLFLAAEHNTTTDEVTVFQDGEIPHLFHADLERLKADLKAAAAANRAERAPQLGWEASHAFAAAAHWGEVRPEWGLARNAAFVVGPRALTRDLDLEGRAFLHSYDWRQDADDSALTLILTAPMVVAQWINCQYLFSTLDNHVWGAGDKTTHNVMGGIGVVQGNGGDLRVGLPRQSLFRDDGTPHHVPQRLLTIVHAPLAKVERVIAANEILQRLFGLGWVQLVVIDPATGRAKRWRADAEMPEETARDALPAV